MRGDTDDCYTPDNVYVSIHAPRMRGDRRHQDYIAVCRVSIHAPRMRGDRYFLK